jgi:hypothetical protein
VNSDNQGMMCGMKIPGGREAKGYKGSTCALSSVCESPSTAVGLLGIVQWGWNATMATVEMVGRRPRWKLTRALTGACDFVPGNTETQRPFRTDARVLCIVRVRNRQNEMAGSRANVLLES